MNLIFSAGIAIQLFAVVYGVCSICDICSNTSSWQDTATTTLHPTEQSLLPDNKLKTPGKNEPSPLKNSNVPSGKDKISIGKHNVTVTIFKVPIENRNVPLYFRKGTQENHSVPQVFHIVPPGNHSVPSTFHSAPLKKDTVPLLCLFPPVHTRSAWYRMFYYRYTAIFPGYKWLKTTHFSVFCASGSIRYLPFIFKYNLSLFRSITENNYGHIAQIIHSK